MAHHKLKLKPFPVPTHVTLEMPAGLKQDGIKSLPIIQINELALEAVDELAEEWLKALYASRNSRSPFRNSNADIAMPAIPYKDGR